MITQTGAYAIRAVVYLADARQRADPRTHIPACEIAEAEGMPHNYLRKILHVLAAAGILESCRGPHGGFHLVREGEALTLKDILVPLDCVSARSCLLGPEGCSHGMDCPSRDRCLTLTGQIEQFLLTTRVVDLVGSEPDHPGSVP